MFVDLLQLLLHLDGEVDQVAAVSELVALKSNIDTRYKMVLIKDYIVLNTDVFIVNRPFFARSHLSLVG